MARFRFKIVDSQGRRRSGILRAESLEVAESALRSKLCQIEELLPLADDGQAVDVGRLESSFAQVDRIRRTLMVLLAIIFMLSLYSWTTRPRKAPPPPPESTEVVKFEASGELLLGAVGGDPSEWTVYVVFPDLPYEVGGRLSDERSDFSFPVEYEGMGRPRQVAVDVQRDGRRWRLPLDLHVPASGDVDLGRLQVTNPKEPEPLVVPTPPPPSPNERVRQRGQRMSKENMKKALEARARGRRHR